jgi:hypothetical protein
MAHVKSGQTERTFQCSLTEKGQAAIDHSYVPPIMRARHKMANRVISWTVCDENHRIVATSVEARSADDALSQFAYVNNHWYAVPKRAAL